MKDQPFKRATPWFLITVFLLLVTSILVTGYFFYQAQQRHIKAEAQNNLAAIADLKVDEIVRWHNQQMNNAESILDDALFAKEVDTYFKNPTGTNRRQELLHSVKDLQFHFHFESILLLDSRSVVRLAISAQGDTIGPHAQALIQEALHHHKVIFSDLHSTIFSPFVHLDLIIPLILVHKKDTTNVGAVLLRIDPNYLLFPLIQKWPTPSRSSETLLIKREGDEVVYISKLRYQKDSTHILRLSISNQELPGSMAVRGIEGIVEGRDYRGVPVLAAIRKIQNTTWFMIAKVDQEEIFASLQFQAWNVGLGTFLLILLSGAIIGFWWRHQRVRFYREKYEAQLERQALVKHFEYLVKYANDIIVLFDMDGKIVEANDQACRTYGYMRDEMYKMNIQDIRTPKSTSEIERQIKSQEERGGLLFETEHRRKDGSAFPVEVSSQFIKIDNAKYLQCIIRDITERKRAEEQFYSANQMLQLVFDNIPQRIFWKDKESRFLGCNRSFAIDAGFHHSSELIGKDDFAMSWKETAKLYRADDALVMQTNSAKVNYEEPQNRPDGSLLWLNTSKVPLHDQTGQVIGILGMYEDISDRKHAEEALRQSEERYRRITQAVTDYIYTVQIKDGQAVETHHGAGCIGITGYTGEEFDAAPYLWFTMIDDQDRHMIQDLHQRLVAKEDVPPVEHRIVRKDGERRWVLNTFVPHYDEHGNLLSYDGLVQDITERKRAEDAMRESEEQFRSLAEHSPNMIFINYQGRVVFANKRCEDIMEYTKEEFYSPGFNFMNLIAPEHRGSVEDNFRRHKNGEELPSLDFALFTKSGKRLETILATQLINYHKEKAILGIITDITERKQAEEALRQTHAFNDLLIQTMPFGMNIVDEEGTILFISKTMKEMLTVDAVTMCCWTVYKDNNQQCQDCPLKKGIPFGKPDVLETSAVLGGKTFQISHVGMMYEGRKAMLEVFQDVTEQKRLQQELMQSQKMLSIGTLAGGIAHDFNNILAIILGYVDILQAMKDDSQKFSTGVNAIKQAVDRGAGLVRQILTFARKGNVEFEPTNIRELTQELVSMLQQTFPKTITFNKEIETGLPVLIADHAQIHQLLLNLCVNARDAMPEGGVITINAHLASYDKIQEHFPTAQEQYYICITVSDTGIGMDESIRSRIFDPFFTTKEKGKGTGLGLSVVYGVVQSHHGFIDVESAVGCGATFRLYLPVHKEYLSTMEAGTVLERALGGNETLLVVEDEDLLLNMVRTLLEENGYTVLTAKDGMEAVKVYSQHQQEIALVISDMGLPKLSGDNEYKKIKEINPEVKMILASGYFEPDSKAALERAGVLGFFQKPYISEEVLKKIRKILD